MIQAENALPSSMAAHRRIPWAGAWIVLLAMASLANAGAIFFNHGARGFFLPALAAGVCLLAALLDGFTGRIPNPLTYVAALLGVGLNGLVPALTWLHAGSALTWLGAVGPKESLLGFAVCFVLGLAASFLAGIHGGDLKLLAAIGAILGLSVTTSVVLLALTVAIPYSLINLVLMGRLNKVLRIGSQRALELVFLRRFQTPVSDADMPGVSQIPMAVPMALGMIAILYLQIRHGRGGLW